MSRQYAKDNHSVILDWHVCNHGQPNGEPFATLEAAQKAQRELIGWYGRALTVTYCNTKIEKIEEPEPVDYRALYQDLSSKVGDQIRSITALAETNKVWVEHHVNAGEYARAAECTTRYKTLDSVAAMLKVGCV